MGKKVGSQAVGVQPTLCQGLGLLVSSPPGRVQATERQPGAPLGGGGACGHLRGRGAGVGFPSLLSRLPSLPFSPPSPFPTPPLPHLTPDCLPSWPPASPPPHLSQPPLRSTRPALLPPRCHLLPAPSQSPPLLLPLQPALLPLTGSRLPITLPAPSARPPSPLPSSLPPGLSPHLPQLERGGPFPVHPLPAAGWAPALAGAAILQDAGEGAASAPKQCIFYEASPPSPTSRTLTLH